MIDLSWSELFFVGLIAILLLKPEEIPVLFRQLGEYSQKVRRWFIQQTRPTWIFPPNIQVQPYSYNKDNSENGKH